METNVCDVNHLDSDVLLPPRKRLLACLKKQNSDSNSNGNLFSPSTCSSVNNIDTRINYLLRAHLTNDNPSQEEIVVASRSAAEVAVKAARAARAAAEEKAVIAAKAMAAAKKALELVATINEDQEISSSIDQHLNKNKTKKQVDVQMLYNSNKPNDEELARKLHQAINSSPRISKCGLPSKHKKLKTMNVSDHGRISNGQSQSQSQTHDKEVENTKKSNGEEDIATLGRKRGRMKQKKLPLSICHDRDQEISRSSFSVGPAEWKCQSFKASACVKQNKVMQS